jgi:hypothetical protein
MRFGIKDVIRRQKKSSSQAREILFGGLKVGLSSFPALQGAKK